MSLVFIGVYSLVAITDSPGFHIYCFVYCFAGLASYLYSDFNTCDSDLLKSRTYILPMFSSYNYLEIVLRSFLSPQMFFARVSGEIR